jgi:Cyclic nucleotide-binding domain
MMVHYTGSVDIATLHPGDIFGESQFLDPKSCATATVTAATNSTILVLEGFFLNTLFRQSAHQSLASHFFRFLLSLVAERLLRSGRSSQFHIPTPKSFHDLSSSSGDESRHFHSLPRSDIDELSGDPDELGASAEAVTDECASSPTLGEESTVLRRFSNADKEQSVVDRNVDADSSGEPSSLGVSFEATNDCSDVVG